MHGINAAARGGGVSGVQSFLGAGHQEFAGGGIWGSIKGAAGDAWGWAKDKASTIAEAVADPAGIISKLAGKATDLIPGSGMVREMTVQAGKNAGPATGEWMSARRHRQLRLRERRHCAARLTWAGSNLARQYGLTITSRYRPRALAPRPASRPCPMHGLNRARDFLEQLGSDLRK